MSRLEELIWEFCPDGVEYKRLGDICKVLRGKRLTKSQLSEEGKYPVLHGGSSPMGYYDEYNRKAGTTVVVNTGNAGSVFYYGQKFWSSDACFSLYPSSGILDRYLYHYVVMCEPVLKGKIRAGAMPTIDSLAVESLVIPVPPLPVQREIVRVLDSFTDLTAELEAELEARKKQYSFYSSKLLEQPQNHADIVSLSSLGRWIGGKTPSMSNKEYWDGGTIPWISSKDMKNNVLVDTEDHITERALENGGMTLLPEGIIAIVTRSGILKHTLPIAYIPFRTTINQDIKALIVREGVSSKYVFHVLQAYAEDIRTKTKKQGGTVDSLEFQKVMNYKIPLPTPDIQNRIVNVLDNFDAICSDLNIGLPAEINARQKQYEYYRDKLLTFDAMSTTILGSDRIGSDRIGSDLA